MLSSDDMVMMLEIEIWFDLFIKKDCMHVHHIIYNQKPRKCADYKI